MLWNPPVASMELLRLVQTAWKTGVANGVQQTADRKTPLLAITRPRVWGSRRLLVPDKVWVVVIAGSDVMFPSRRTMVPGLLHHCA
jgi:hypothetical protein